MSIRVGDTVYIDYDIKYPVVVKAVNRVDAYTTDGRCFPLYRLTPKGKAFAMLLDIKLYKKYKVDGYPYGLYIAKERGIYEIINGVEYDITNRLMDTPLKDVLLKKKKMTEDGWVRLKSFSFKVSDTSAYTFGNYSIFV